MRATTRRPPGPAALLLLLLAACAPSGGGADGEARATVTLPGSLLGAEGEALRRQIERFEAAHPGIDVETLETPDAADERRQLYVQWLNAGVGDPDVLQLDVVWVPEFAAAGWILSLDEETVGTDDAFEGVLAADRWNGALHAAPWFVDVGMLYRRTDLVGQAPATLDELSAAARRARNEAGLPHGLVLQGARYEGLVTVFVELLGAFGGRILDGNSEVVVDAEPAVAALTWLRDAVHEDGVVPEAALTWREERARLAFQDGRAAFMRNWPYAWSLLADEERSAVSGRVAVSPMPAGPGGEPTACLGGQHLAVNARSEHPEAARALVAFLTHPEQMLERARLTGQLPARPSVYEDPALAEALAIPPAQVLDVVRRARPRPVTPLYAELSQALQTRLHRALTGQATPRDALAEAAAAMREVLAAARAGRGRARLPPAARVALALALLAGGVLLLRGLARRRGATAPDVEPAEARLARALALPALAVIALVAAVPLGWTVWESLHRHDVRMPSAGRPFVGLANYAEALRTPRVWEALLNTLGFTAVSVALELVLGLALALVLERSFRGRGLARVTVLLPWALPTVVAALVWRFLFEGRSGLVDAVLVGAGVLDEPLVWLGGALSAWVPIVLADVWRTTPFVALLLLAGLQTIDREVRDAARIDGAGAWRRLLHVILPLLRPTLLVVLLFRSLDAIRVFDLVYALTGGGPGTATEPISLTTFTALLGDLRFGYGSALAVLVVAVAAAAAWGWLRLLGGEAAGEHR